LLRENSSLRELKNAIQDALADQEQHSRINWTTWPHTISMTPLDPNFGVLKSLSPEELWIITERRRHRFSKHQKGQQEDLFDSMEMDDEDSDGNPNKMMADEEIGYDNYFKQGEQLASTGRCNFFAFMRGKRPTDDNYAFQQNSEDALTRHSNQESDKHDYYYFQRPPLFFNIQGICDESSVKWFIKQYITKPVAKKQRRLERTARRGQSYGPHGRRRKGTETAQDIKHQVL